MDETIIAKFILGLILGLSVGVGYHFFGEGFAFSVIGAWIYFK